MLPESGFLDWGENGHIGGYATLHMAFMYALYSACVLGMTY